MTCSTFLRGAALGFFVLNMATACKSNNSADEIFITPPPCNGTSASPAGRVVMQPRETLLPTGPSLALQCRDDVAHPCSNFTLQRTVASTATGFQINFTGPAAPGICLTSIGPAYTSIDLANTATGTYVLDLQAGTKRTTGTLLVLPDRVELTTCDSNTVAVRGSVLHRIPANAIWGQLYARTPAAQTAATALLDSLRREGAQPLTLPAGSYGYFRVDASGQLVPIPNLQNGQPAWAVATPVLMSFTGNFNRIKGVVRRRAQYNDLSAGISSARGEMAF